MNTKIQERQRRWYRKNRKEILKKRALYYAKNRKTINERSRAYGRTPEGYAQRMYSNILRRVGQDPYYLDIEIRVTKKDFLDFLQTTNFLYLHRRWVKSGYKFPLAPSIDRIDSRGHYELGNMQVLTVSENASKRNAEVRVYCAECRNKIDPN